jgi:hypothetical protein
MKCRRIALLLFLAAVAAMVMGCDFPDFSLDFQDVSVQSCGTGYVTVAYGLTNTGMKRLTNAMVRVHVETTIGTTASGSAWTPSTDIDVGETVGGTMDVWLYPSATFTAARAWVIEAAWDEEGGSIFDLESP